MRNSTTTNNNHHNNTAALNTSNRNLNPPCDPTPTLYTKEALETTKGGSDGGVGKGGGSGGGGDPDVCSMVDLIKLLHESEHPVWDLLRFEVRHLIKT